MFFSVAAYTTMNTWAARSTFLSTWNGTNGEREVFSRRDREKERWCKNEIEKDRKLAKKQAKTKYHSCTGTNLFSKINIQTRACIAHTHTPNQQIHMRKCTMCAFSIAYLTLWLIPKIKLKSILASRFSAS